MTKKVNTGKDKPVKQKKVRVNKAVTTPIVENNNEQMSSTEQNMELNYTMVEPTLEAGIVVKVLNRSDNPLPKYETKGSVGMDVRAAEGATILPGEVKMIKTGLYIELPQGYEMQIRARSGLAFKHGIQLANGIGTVDEDYKGECNVLLYNSSKVVFKVYKTDRIAQFVLSVKPKVVWEEVEILEETVRGEGGFGHTGKN